MAEKCKFIHEVDHADGLSTAMHSYGN